MADIGVAPSAFADTSISNSTPPVAFVVAVWLGMSHDAILSGLRDGSIAPPFGAPPDWAPDWGTDGNSSGGNEGGGPSDAPDTGGGGSGGADPRPVTIDRATIRGWFTTLDPTLSASSFDQLWTNAGADDGSRANKLFGYLQRTLLGGSGESAVARTQAAAADASSVSAALSSWLAQPGHHAGVVSLAGKDGAELARLARTDVGYRYALAHLDPIALAGNRAIFAASNADGSLDRFDTDTGEANLTDAWLTDRAKMLAWKMRMDAHGDASSSSDEDWIFIDRTMRDSDGNPMKLQISGAGNSTRTNQVIFGANAPDGEMLKGGTGTDRIYGGTGDDIIRGNAGNDHLEGGRGDDLVMGGAGNDELVGGQGSDEMEGGSGADLLQGNSGDDTLAGGSGADRMEGGAGFDTYAIESGDGADTIVDSDGQGEIQLDGEVLGGATLLADGRYGSADGKAIYSLAGDIDAGRTLTISFYANANPGANDLPTNTVEIKNWKNGDLGIQLGGDGSGDTSTDAGSGDGSGSLNLPDPPVGTEPPLPPDQNPIVNTDWAGGGGGDGSGGSGADTGSASNGGGGAAADMAISPRAASAGVTPTAGIDSSSTVMNPPDIPILDVLGTSTPLVNAENLDAALRAFSSVPEAPDVTNSASAMAQPAIGVTVHDLSSAMLDFHDSGDFAIDHGGSEPLPPPMATLTSQGHETGISVTGGGTNVMSTNGMARRGA
jgi:Ca2+-binding RTX toxin-like protein